MNMDFQQAPTILTISDYRSDSLMLIPFIITVVLFIVIPLIGFFAGYRRALFWSIGNWIFILIGWGIFTLAGDSMGNLISDLVIKLVNGNGSQEINIDPNDVLLLVKDLLGPIFYLLVLFFSNAILLCFYFLFGKKLLGITKHKAAIKARKKTNFFIKHEVVSKFSGAFLFVVIGMPIIANVSQVSYAFTTSNITRDEQFNSHVNSGIDKMSMDLFKFTNTICKYNPTNYWYSVTQTVDAAYDLTQLISNNVINHSLEIMTKIYIFIATRPVANDFVDQEKTDLAKNIAEWNVLFDSIDNNYNAFQYSSVLSTKSARNALTGFLDEYVPPQKQDPENFDYTNIFLNIEHLKEWFDNNGMAKIKINISKSDFDQFNTSIEKLMFEVDKILPDNKNNFNQFTNEMGMFFFNVSNGA